MKINNKEVTVDELVKDIDFEKDMLKDYGSGILLSDTYIEILNRYQINYKEFSNINSLINEIEDYLNDSCTDNDDLEWLSQQLAERNYYQNTKK